MSFNKIDELKSKYDEILDIVIEKLDDSKRIETFKESYFNKKMVFSITSKSKKNVLRGLHLQTKKTQDKLITCLKGKILDVVVDLRKNSKTFGKHYKIVISEKKRSLFFGFK